MKNAKVKSTKRSLIMSVLSLMLCVAMLLGTTYAWFTDSVTSGKNKIVAGNLDVELTHSNAKVTTPEDVQDSTDLFKFEKVGNSYKEVLWEPGMVVYENFTVSNVGNLALKYALSLNVFDKNTYNGKDLTEVIKVAVVEDGFSGDRAAALGLAFETLADFQKTGNLAAKNDGDTDESTYGVVLYWEPTDHDNEYNVNNYTGEIPTSDHQPLFVEFGIKLFASQLEHEYDSFGNDYDGEASYSETVTATVAEGKDTVFFSAVTPSNENGNQTKVTFPKEINAFADAAGKETTMTVEATPTVAANHKFTVSSNNNGSVGAIDLTVKVDGTEVTEFMNESDQPVEVIVETYIAKGLTLNNQANTVSVVYEGEGDQPTFVSYDTVTGKLVFKTKHFSTFLIDADQVAYVESNNTAYKDFGGAMSACRNNDTIHMLKNYKYATSPNYVYNQNAKYTIDLNGYTLDFNDSGYGLYVLKGQTVTINDSVGTGKLKNRQCLIYELDGGSIIVNGGHLGGVDKDKATIYGYGNVTINGGVVDTAKYSGYDYYAAMIGNYTNNNTPAKFVMTGGEVNGSLYINGQDTDANIINISGGAINGSSYIAGQNTTTITGGVFTGTTCFYFRAGTINISGGTFSANKGDGDWKHLESSSVNTGDAVIIEDCAYPNGSPNVNITGGTFKGYKEEGGTEATSGNIFFKNYGILVINYGGNTANMSGTTVPYRNAVVASNSAEGFVTSNGYIHFTDDNTTLVTPNAE